MGGRVGRRGFLVAGGAGALTACASPDAEPGRATPAPSPSPHTTGSSSAGVSASAGTPPAAPPTAADWERLARHVTGPVARPGSASYDRVRLVQNPRYDGARPLAVLSATSADDVATGLAFARDHALPVAIRSGGHAYPGWSAGDGRLVLDLRPLHRVSLSGTTATVGAGASLVHVYDALGTRGRGIAAGSCPTVGFGGLALGGGIGVLTRAHGLTCDAVTAMQVVLADGRTVTATKHREPDLFWALRGGGGGHLGVVTSFTMRTFAAPTITRFYLQWPLSALGRVLPAWLGHASSADRRLWSTLKALGGRAHPSGPIVVLAGTWLGHPDTLTAALRPLMGAAPRPTVNTRTTAGYRDTMLAYAGCSTIGVSRCHTGPGGALPRGAFAATSHIVRETDTTAGVVDTITTHVERAGSLFEAGVALDSLGGAMAQVAPHATPFWHRRAVATAQYTATYSSGSPAAADRFVHAFRHAMVPAWGIGAYVNYADASLADPMTSYFGKNAVRLARVGRAYDPDGFFTQPQGY
ncbi:MAG: FAD-binding oxidoreductase [Nocardioides sp.]